MAHCLQNDIHPRARETIGLNVRWVSRGCKLRGADRQDLAQDLALHAHEQAKRYDPARGAECTFYDLILLRRATSWFRRARAACRSRWGERCLDPDEPQACYDPGPADDLRLDMQCTLNALPAPVRELANRLMAGDSTAEAGRNLGWPRGKVRHAQQLLAQELQSGGLEPSIKGGRS